MLDSAIVAKTSLGSFENVMSQISRIDPQSDELMRFSCHNTLEICLIRTALGLFREPGMVGSAMSKRPSRKVAKTNFDASSPQRRSCSLNDYQTPAARVLVTLFV
jgi:hypothetical protein